MPVMLRFSPRVFELDRDLEPAAALARLSGHRLPILLDSAGGTPRTAGVLGFDPVHIPAQDLNSVRDFRALRALHAQLLRGAGDALPGPFHGGLLCALAYDLGVQGEHAPQFSPEPWGQPLFVGGLYVDFIVRDEVQRRTWLVLGEQPGDERASVAERGARIEAELAAAGAKPTTRAEAARRHTSSAEHMRRIESLRASIAAGELYQANLAHRFSARASGSPEAWYAKLRHANPAPYMGFARWRESDGFQPGGALLSASPELLFELREGVARTRPIKGTIARAEAAREDLRRAQQLLHSEKDLAELAMIVDLERNDLGRCAVPGGVHVEDWPSLQSYPRVHHLMADVVARTRADVDAFDVLAALFPGGSITGAPKLAAMRHIAGLEGHGRGFFTGALGFVDLRGHAAFNVLIRSFLWREQHGGELSFQVGGGITWSSDPRAEEAETLVKAAGMLAALDSETC
jgi:anthranilate/para-aminobenzoate synthase component I